MMFYAAATQILKAFRQDERGATAIEYAMIGAVISISFVVAVKAIGEHPLPALDLIADALTGGPDPE
ncbi:Flp family type IVb pilin [Agaricicola taiwanensis]|nr:Flp family type IVb pilin [Agaricicola taiwanensis]